MSDTDGEHRLFEPAHPSPERTLEIIRVISHPVRRKILRTMMFGEPMRVSDVAGAIDEPPNSVSYHLRQLARVGIAHTTEPAEAHDARETWWVIDDWTGLSVDVDAVRALPGGDLMVAELAQVDSADAAGLFSLARAEAAEAAGLPSIRSDGPLALTRQEADNLVRSVGRLFDEALDRSRRHGGNRDDVERYEFRVAIMPGLGEKHP